MATKGSVFVDTSGWAYLVDRSAELHHSVHAIYQQMMAQRRLFVTTNYIIAELVALLTSRSRIPRQQIVIFIDALKRPRMLKLFTSILISMQLHGHF